MKPGYCPSCGGRYIETAACDDFIHRMAAQLKPGRPYAAPETSLQVRARAQQERSIATSLKMQGKAVKPEYESLTEQE